nr:immunoglobulin light chain junction region [Macaca mulatta]MOX49812.1 immunoglobulin light chain junction region [Macaca mulatta]MOX49918.1 immunoglobulin light chain junction region [Macaca mulatta]MOX50702.1 immunoglobulin light chain junction region [Macaca mulatta]MOX50857.1 immunoglobulin light chain junction region [Macaca mulatta]
CQQAYKKPFTF